MSHHSVAALFISAALATRAVPAPTAVTDTRQQPLSATGGCAIRGSLELPADGLWRIAPDQNPAAPHQLHILPSARVIENLGGRRMRDVEREQAIQRGQWPLYALYNACLTYAVTNANRGPARIEVLDAGRTLRLTEQVGRSPWADTHPDLQGPFVYLAPNVLFRFGDPKLRRVPEANRELLAFELQPFVDDGKHWVMYTDGTCRREPVDAPRIAALGQRIRPVTPADAPQAHEPDTAVYTLVATARPGTPDTFDVRLANALTDAKLAVRWTWRDAPTDASVTNDLRRARAAAVAPYAQAAPSPALYAWLSADRASRLDLPERESPPDASVFGLLGGRPAVEETLQMQHLRGTDDRGARTVDVTSIPGVQVKSHPFAEMLGETKVTPPAILDLVPADHFAIHVVKPSALLPLLNDGADFLANLGGTATGKGVRYYLKDRYLAQLGLSEAWLQRLLRSGVVREMALFVPDLFLIDGTDVTVISRVSQPAVLTELLKLVGVADLGNGGVAVVAHGDGHQTFWALKGEHLLVSTCRAELDLALALAVDPAGSLGRSDEFRFMLTQLPIGRETRMLAYLSDPFIRRLVSPAVKIGQLRRALARMRMEHLTSQALLAAADGVARPVTPDTLRQRGYLPADAATVGLSLTPDGHAVSDIYGTLAHPVSLSAAPVTMVTATEAEAYRSYLENYNRFWRRFFDPIAIRIDDAADGGLELTTFILPLIDNSLYTGMKEMLVSSPQTPLNVPRFTPEPVLVFSLNLAEPAWKQITEGLAELFQRYVRLSPAILDDLGPAAHLAVFDADPVIALGSGDILGAFGGNMGRMRGAEMVGLPLALSILTRPCALAIETRDPAHSIRLLRQATAATGRHSGRRDREMSAEFYQVDDRNEWVYTMDVLGMIKLRFGIEVAGRHLIVRNIPWAQAETQAGTSPSPLNAARLAAIPAACAQQLPALHASAMEKERQAAMQGAGRLFPIAYALDLSADQALSTHAMLYGFAPAHPAGGAWTGDARGISSTRFGRVDQQRQPAFNARETAAFGALQRIERLNVSMQFEDDGLRTVLQWKTRPRE